MITDRIVDAIDLMDDMCRDDNQSLGIRSVREMLCDFSESEWEAMSQEERKAWIAQHMSCEV